MRRSVLSLCISVLAAAGCQRETAPLPPAVPPVSGTVEMPGLSAPVRIVRDTWGVPHITAASRDDLFFAQGFVQAGDRLFQMDLWRRSVQGRLAEVLGANFVGRDAMTRRVQYRGSLDEEWASYGPDTKAIASAFVAGINAWVAIARDRPPESFRLAGWLPDFWRPEDLLNRTDAFLASGDALAEVFRARLATEVGASRAAALLGGDAAAGTPPGIDLSTVTFQVGDSLREIGPRPFLTALQRAPASNAWAIAGSRTSTGSPIVASDPHRLLAAPSPYYLVHLTAPGWNVAGAATPWLPGVAIGHNDRVAWGMTAFEADTADLYVERLNPDNRHQIEVDGRWQNTTVVREWLGVKGRAAAIPLEREYTPHGVVIAVDRQRQLAFTLRWSGLERGAAGGLAALALNRAESAAGVRAALAQWKMPSADVVYAERDGTIASQVAALVPIRRGWDGRLPAPGWTGRAEWEGWRTLDDLPHADAPVAGYLASANGNRARTERLHEAFRVAPPQRFSVEHSASLQHDVLAWNAGRLVPLLARLRAERPEVEQARQRLLEWDRRISADSVEAAIYVTWERLVRRLLVEPHVPGSLVDGLAAHAASMLVPALTSPSRVWFEGNVGAARDRLLLRALEGAVDELTRGAGLQPWGQVQRVIFAHPLGITETARRRFNVGPFGRGGYAETVMSIEARRLDAAAGASFSAVFDTADWDRSIVINAPGQSESPDSVHYADLAKAWTEGTYVPLAFSDDAVTANARSTVTLVPRR